MKLFAVALAIMIAPAMAAQQPADTAEAGRLRAQIEQRFSDQVQENLRLNPDQASKLKATQEKFGAQRRTIMQQQMDRRRALDDQMQPGMPANSDSVNKLMAGMRDGRAQMVKIDQDEDREMSGYLTPVQRARYQQMRERLMQRVNEMRMERRQEPGMGAPRPRLAPGPRPRAGRRRP
ncbi:MAG TPA: hypothetical protein VKQ05_01190 [Gemmatimonadales bacterium]|nr:hypothetical protein [Gemmatimonadales bacterium]